MQKLTARDQENGSDQDIDLNSDDLYTDVVYLNTVQAYTKKSNRKTNKNWKQKMEMEFKNANSKFFIHIQIPLLKNML